MSGQTTEGNFSQILREKLKTALENYEQHLIKQIDFEAITWELMTLLDRIEVECEEGFEDPALMARQRFDIMKAHGLEPKFGEPVSARQQ